MKKEIDKKKEADVGAYVTPEQIKRMRSITDEIKRLKGQKMVKEEIEKLNGQLNELKKTHRKQPTNKVVKIWVGGLRKMIKWWTMSDLTPQQREAKRKRFEESGNILFGGEGGGDKGEMPNMFGGSSGNNQGMPSFFGGSEEHDDNVPGFLDEMIPQRQKKTKSGKSKAKSQGKQSKKHTKKQKGRQKYVIRNGKAYPVARDEPEETRHKPKKRKVAKKVVKKKQEDEEEGPGMFFDING